MEALREILNPDFLLRNSVYMSLLVGAACPLVGVYLLVRRLLFMGVALPQISSCGIAFAFALHAWGSIPHTDENTEHALAFIGSSVFTLTAILLLSFLQRKSRALLEGTIGLVYVLAGAGSILLLVKNPFGEHGLLDRLKGEIISVSNTDLAWTAIALTIVLLAMVIFRREFMLVSFDREMAITLRKKALFWDAFLLLLIGVTISITVLSVGPLVTFGLLLIPPLTAHLLARNMRQFFLMASAFGAFTSFAGFYASYRWDYPVGPTIVALSGVFYLLMIGVKKLLEFTRRVPSAAT